MPADITRLFPHRDTRFRALVRQQGRLPIDAEENFASDLAEREREDAFVESIAPCGSPDDGFRISLPVAGPPADFTVAAGSYYIGGARIENPTALTYRGQAARNWLTFATDTDAIGSARRFLVWLDVTDAVVTATEDAELLDPGLGGPDGAAAKRFGWRIRATPVAGPGCVLARQQWLGITGWTGRVDATGALRSDASLSVTFNPAAVAHDLCAPSVTPGYLGAENACYRVMVSRTGRFVWGDDAAATLYRVRVDSSGARQRIVFLTKPRDERMKPQAGQTVELLRWDELLPNGQKTAERLGAFFTVGTGYVDDSIELLGTVDAARFTGWLAGLPPTIDSPEDALLERRYFYLRLWSGGGAGGQVDHPLAPGNMTGTGLELVFSGTPTVGDQWTIAARPNAPSKVMPWSLKTGKSPDGPRRHVVPLAFVDLDAGTVIDCRRRFRPLYRQGGCCTVTVGDQENSWGDVSTIAEAIALLPASGGEICIGPGRWDETIDLTGRRDIVFTGCGQRSRWHADDVAQPLLRLSDCHNITVRRLAMTSGDAPCIVIDRDAAGPGTRDIHVEDCRLTTPSGGVVHGRALTALRIARCHVRSGPLPDPAVANAAFAAITLQGDSLQIVDSTIIAEAGTTAQTRPLGGIHVLGGSSGIDIHGNMITAGAGNGITLGSATTVSIPVPSFTGSPDRALEDAIKQGGGALPIGGFTVDIDAAGCIRIVPDDPDPTSDPDTIEVPISDGAVVRVRVSRNRISACGASGIATYPLLPVGRDGDPAWDAVAVHQVLIESNEIVDNVRREQAVLPPLQAMYMGVGGIALGLATDVTVRDNEILRNGAEPPRVASGIFIGYGEAVRIERNRIESNGMLAATALGTTSGGIVLRMTMGGAPADDVMIGDVDRPALSVQGNIVHSPTGRALRALAQGPVMVNGNRLTGANRSSLFTDPRQAFLLLLVGRGSVTDVLRDPSSAGLVDLLLFDAIIDILGGDAVNIVNLSFMEEAVVLARIMPYMTGGTSGSASLAALRKRQGLSAANFRGGETMFNDNQIALRSGATRTPLNMSSVLIFGLDDVSYADNQSEIEPDVMLVLLDTLLAAPTLRATGNRVQAGTFALMSLSTTGLMANTTAHNQTTAATDAKCANPSKLVSTGNLTIF